MNKELDLGIEKLLEDLDSLTCKQGRLHHEHFKELVRGIANQLDREMISITSSDSTLTDLLSAIQYYSEINDAWDKDPVILVYANEEGNFVGRMYLKGES